MDVQYEQDAVTDLLVAVPLRRHGLPRRPRRASAHSRRRPGLLLGALLAGGVAASVIGVSGLPTASAESTSVLEAQQALAASDEGGLDVMPQASITVAEARARLQEVRATRAERQQAAE